MDWLLAPATVDTGRAPRREISSYPRRPADQPDAAPPTSTGTAAA
jgi:hypothetical protein